MNLNFNYNYKKRLTGGGGPVNTVAPVITGTAERGEVLTCSQGTWTGTGTITYAYQWKRNGLDIPTATANTYTLVAADDNANITCIVTATDTEGSRSRSSNSVLALGAPYNLVAPVLSGTAQVGQTLTVSEGTWQGVSPITYAYKWFRNGIEIAGETLSAYTLVAADYNTVIYAQVIASNSISTTTIDSNFTAAIAGTAPIISGVPTISGTENVAEVLTATPASVSGVPTPSNSYQWQRSADGLTGWANITGATSSTYTLVLADENNYIRVIQTSSNVVGSDDSVSGSTGQIGPEQLFDLDYQAVLDYATTQGYTLPSAGQQVLQNQLVLDLKAAGVWSKLDFFGVNAVNGDSDFALIDWIRLITTTAVNSPTFTTNVGYQGNGTSSYIDLNYNPSVDATNFLLNNHCFGGYNHNATAQQGVFISSFSGAFCEISNDNPASRFIVYDSSTAGRTPNVGANNQDGHLMIDRNNASTFEFYKDNVNQPFAAVVSVALPNTNFRLFSRSNNSFYGNGQSAYYFGGASLNNTERQALIDSIDTYLTSI